MNRAFYALPEEKRNRIRNAAMNVFASNEYNRALTDDIAAQAGISKGSLFYYFQNKRELYTYLYKYSLQLMVQRLNIPQLTENTDLFDMLLTAQKSKLRLLKAHPALFEFLRRAYYNMEPPLSDQIQSLNRTILDKSGSVLLERMDMSKLKDGVDPQMVVNLIFWSAEGYAKKYILEEKTNLTAMAKEFEEYLYLLRAQFYKEEALT